jgi:hypothetical protein
MSKPWFAPKQFGYGSSWPISWEGWAVLIAFCAAVSLVIFTSLRLDPLTGNIVRLAGVGLLLAIFVAIARAKTDGGWRWRDGRD